MAHLYIITEIKVNPINPDKESKDIGERNWKRRYKKWIEGVGLLISSLFME